MGLAPELLPASISITLSHGAKRMTKLGVIVRRLNSIENLGILREGIDEGRMTFANTLKYILTTISANFGNMLSMAAASVFLPLLAIAVALGLPYLPYAAIFGFVPLPAPQSCRCHAPGRPVPAC